MIDYAVFGRNVRKYRLIQDISQEKLAELCGCGNSHIGQIENGRGVPSLEMAVRIANALKITVDQLLQESYSEPQRVYLKEIAERIKSYPLAKRIVACEGLIGYLDALENFSQSKVNHLCYTERLCCKKQCGRFVLYIREVIPVG